MIRKRLLSACLALALCLNLLPATALAADGIELYVGGQQIKESGCYENQDGNWTKVGSAEPASGQFSYDAATATLTLNQAKIVNCQDVTVGGGFTYPGSVIAFSQSADVSLTIEVSQGTSNITGTGGIRVVSKAGDASLSISGPGSLEVKNVSNDSGIVLIGSKNVNLGINSADVTISNVQYYGVQLAAGDECKSTATINDGNLTVSDSVVGIYFMRLYTSGPSSLTVSGNAMVDTEGRTGGIINGFPDSFQIGADGESGGIVFNGNSGTVYGNVTLQDDLEIKSGESLTVGKDASLTVPDGKTLTNNGTVTTEEGGTLTGNITNAPPKINTEGLSEGTVNTEYNQTLAADNNPTSWSVTNGALPKGLTLENGTISGIPTAAGTSTFTVKAENTAGSDSKELTLTINPAPVLVTSVTLNKSELSLYTGQSEILTATVQPEDATNKNVTWSSDKPEVATVENGEVTAKAAGTATITATADGKSATCTVTVTAATVPVTGVTLNKDSLALGVGDSETLTATVAPANAANQNVTWASSDTSVATVDAAGKVTAVGAGTATITVTTVDGGKTAACTVTVRPDIPPANPNYRITVEATQGGTVTADPTAAKAGATVTLTPVPDRGYQVGTVAVTDRFGEAVAVTENADGTYVFTMPNGQVTVTVTFEQAPLPFPDVAEGDWFYDAVVYAYETGLMDGVGDSLFAPNSETTRAQLVTILYRLEGEPEVSGTSGFSDVAAGTWYTDAVAWAAENGIVNGVNDTEFAPGDDLTRQQLVTILYRYAESKGYDVSASADLSGYPDAGQVQDYAQPAMAWAVAEGIVEGVDGNLNPAGNATRAQIATILMRFCEGIQP